MNMNMMMKKNTITMNTKMKNKGEDKREHEHEHEHDDEDEIKDKDEDDSLNMNSCTKMMSDPFRASGGNPRALLAPQEGIRGRFRAPERFVFESKSGLERVQSASKSIATTSIVSVKYDHLGRETYCNDVDRV